MKKLNLLSRAEMKKVIGGNIPVDELGDGEAAGTCKCTNGTSVTCKHCSESENKLYCDGKFEKNC